LWFRINIKISERIIVDILRNISSYSRESVSDLKEDNLRVLVIDNEDQTVSLLNKYLIDSGYCDVRMAKWMHAMTEYHAYNPDILIVGVVYPLNEGMEIIKSISSEESKKEIIIYTDQHDKQLFYEALKLQVCDILTKPICPDDLDAALSRAKKRLESKKEQEKFFISVMERTQQVKNSESDAIPAKMIQGIIHNLNAPLCAISGNAQLLEHGLENLLVFLNNYCSNFEPVVYKELTNKIKRFKDFSTNQNISTERMKDIISNFLSKWRNENDRNETDIDINNFIKIEMEYMNSDLEFKNQIKKEIVLSPGIPLIRGVYSDFSQVFTNLVNNAVKAMSKNQFKELKVITRQDSECVYVEVYDNGCGIDSDKITKIFDDFYTDWNNLKENDGNGNGNGDIVSGTGVGLANCLELMKSYDSGFDVKSELGKGTCFIWKIPKVRALVLNDRF